MAYVTLDQTKKVAQAVKNYTDGEVGKMVEKIDGKGLSTEDFSTEDKTKLESLENYDDTAIRQLIQQVKDDLASYYKKSETYSKVETDEIVSQINALEIIPVISLPTENIAKAIYLVKDSDVEGNIYSEYIYVDNKWEKFGTAVIDLSNYVTFTDLETKLNEKVKTNVPENAVFTDTVYDDSALTSRMERAETAIENLQTNGYDDTDIKNDINDLKTGKVDVVNGKELSSNDFTNDYKNKLDGLENYDDTEVRASITELQQSTAGQIASSITTINQVIANLENAKVDKVDGKDLSDNNYSTEEKDKLASLENYDDTEVKNDITNLKSGKVNIVSGKELSTNDFTNEYKDKLDSLENYDDSEVKASIAELQQSTAVQIASSITTINQAIANLEEIKVSKVDGKDLSDNNYTTEEKNKLASLKNYDDTYLAGRVSTVETTIADKANTADLSAVATSGSYNDLADTPDEYILPEASDTTLGGIKVDSTSGATVEDGVLKVTQQAGGSGGGAIPAYIVGDTMTQGWLSLEDGGEALTPADKQEYIILSSGDWLRKHVMWMADLGVYRLTGKIGVVSNVTRSIKRPASFVTKLNGTIPQTVQNRNARNTTNAISLQIMEGDVIKVSFQYGLRAGVGLRQIHVGAPNNWSETVTTNDVTHPYDNGTSTFTSWGTWDSTYEATQDMIDNGFVVQLDSTSGSDGGTQDAIQIRNGQYWIDRNVPYTDYETDDIIDITEEEIDAIWSETAGEPAPENNVIAVGEERLWGYWKENGVTKPIYRKTVSCGALPNSTMKSVSHGIVSIANVINIQGVAKRSSDGTTIPLPHATESAGSQTSINVGTATINIGAQSDRSMFDSSYVTLCYTKT